MATSKTYARCRGCGAGKDDGITLSKRGYCPACGHARRNAAIDDQHYHEGYYFEVWRRAMAACVGAVLLDDDNSSA